MVNLKKWGRKIWRILFPTVVWLTVIYIVGEVFELVVSITADEDVLTLAKSNPSEFIVWFLAVYVGFLLVTVGLLYGAHRLLHLRGNYEIPLGILSLITVFTTLATLIIQFAGANIPKGFLMLTLVNILLSVALTATSKLLKLQRARAIKKRKSS